MTGRAIDRQSRVSKRMVESFPKATQLFFLSLISFWKKPKRDLFFFGLSPSSVEVEKDSSSSAISSSKKEKTLVAIGEGNSPEMFKGESEESTGAGCLSGSAGFCKVLRLSLSTSFSHSAGMIEGEEKKRLIR